MKKWLGGSVQGGNPRHAGSCHCAAVTKANANLITEGVEGIDFHPVALNRVYKSAVIK